MSIQDPHRVRLKLTHERGFKSLVINYPTGKVLHLKFSKASLEALLAGDSDIPAVLTRQDRDRNVRPEIPQPRNT